ncbi:FHA domain-containing protein [Candidatus Sumerlaeota bacterium]|nr:FHA domain-containing protein [Candidatus Sumerlaeota bacterium]
MPELIVKLGENIVHRYFFEKDVLSIGRAKDNDIVIENLSVSRNHARIRKVDNKFILTDLNSANGTYVNNVRITKTDLCHDDIVTIGKHKIHFINVDLSDEQIISDAFGAERTMIVDKTPVARLLISKGKQQGQEFKITKTETYIGRSSDNDIRLHDWFVSKKHAMILRQGQNFFIKDLKSWRGTMVNGKFTRESPLNDNDSLQFGSTIMSFHVATEEEALKITGRVPKELVELEEELMAERAEAGVSEPSREEKIKAGEEKIHKMAQAEEEEVALMQSAWEPLDEDQLMPPEAPEVFSVEEKVKAEVLEQEVEQVEEIKTVEEQMEEIMEEQPVAVGEETGDIFDLEESSPEKGIEMEEPAHEEALEEELAEEYEEEIIEKKSTDEIKIEEPPAPAPETPRELPEGINQREVEMWQKALQNPSKVIRKNAAKFLKKLTGKDYEY